jgi:carbon-monoxide dehydrogenase medium subunit
VKPPPFTYHRPADRDEVDSLLAEFDDDAKILAGGQSLIPILNMRLAAPGHLIDINHLTNEPDEPSEEDGHVSFGPLVRDQAAHRWASVNDRVPLLAEAMPYVAHPAIRTRGTVVGSIAHADPAAELPAVLAVLEGTVAARSSSGAREIAAADFFAGPLENTLQPGEWVEAVRWPKHKGGWGYAFEEFARRSGDYALCGVAAAARPTGNGAVEVAVSYLGMGDIPQRLSLQCGEADVDDAVAQLVANNLDPPRDLHARPDFRAHLARRLGARAVRRALEVRDEDP